VEYPIKPSPPATATHNFCDTIAIVKKLRAFLIFLIIILIAAVTVLSINLVKKNQKTAEIVSPLANLSEKGTIAGISTKSASPTASPSATPSKKVSTVSGNLKIALLGDSMVDTFLYDPKIFKVELTKVWPAVNFEILNYGVGATNAEYGFTRLTQSYDYQGKTVPSLLSQNPNIVIVESFAYNHPQELSQNTQTLSQIISTIQSGSKAKIYFLVSIAPDKKIYAQGIEGITWTPEQRSIEAQKVIDFLRDAVAFAQNQGLPLINAYQKSLDWEGDGNQEYISEDNIHPSEAGKLLIADLIVEKFQTTQIIEKLLK